MNKKLLIVFIISLIFFKAAGIFPIFKKPVMKLEEKRVCSTFIPYENDKIIAFGGYNKNGSDDVVKLYDLKNKKVDHLFKSNFDNSYGNFASIIEENGEKLLINIQPRQFRKDKKYGVEIYDFNKKELNLLYIPIRKREENEKITYAKTKYGIYLSDGSNYAEKIDYINFIYGAKNLLCIKKDILKQKISDI